MTRQNLLLFLLSFLLPLASRCNDAQVVFIPSTDPTYLSPVVPAPIQVHQMDRKMDSVLKILMEQFPPQPQLTSQPSIRRVTIQKRKGTSIDDGP